MGPRRADDQATVPRRPRARPAGPRPRRGPGRGREAPLRIKKIAERRTTWGGGRLRRKRGAEDPRTDENNHKNEARDDWTGCTFRVERGPKKGRAWGKREEALPAPTSVLIDDDDGAAPASHYSTIASHRDPRRCHDGGTARPRSPRARPTPSRTSLGEFVRALLPQLDLTSGGPARGLHAPPGPNGLLRRPSCSPRTVYPPIVPLTTPRVVPLSPAAVARSRIRPTCFSLLVFRE